MESNPYRGKRSSRKKVILLILILLAACASLVIQHFLVFREDGSVYLSWQKDREPAVQATGGDLFPADELVIGSGNP